MKKLLILAAISVALPSCTWTQIDKLKQVGKEPELEKVSIPADKSAPINWPFKAKTYDYTSSPNSLWRPGSKSFFGDNRARSVGDILMVRIRIDDKAELDNKTERRRDGRDTLGVPALYGLQGKLTGLLPGNANPASLLDLNSVSDNTGEGNIEREEVIETSVAAAVTQVLPNGNLVIYGTQEIRVNFEVRQVTVQGVARAVDVDPQNTIDISRLAEARVSYGGRGLITDVQQPRVGSQIIDALSPW